MKAQNYFNEDYNVLTKFFPAGWRVKIRELNALNRCRNVKSANVLIRLLLIHLADGCSLRETVARARQSKLASLSDVALLKRLRNASHWFNWMSLQLLHNNGVEYSPPKWLKNYKVKAIDASVITEPGSTGTDWRLHYSMNLYNLCCEDFIITKPSTGESFCNFKIQKGDLLIGDRAYGRLKGLHYVRTHNGDFISRYMSGVYSLEKDHMPFKLLQECRAMKYGEIKDWPVDAYTKSDNPLKESIRICAIKKSEEQAEKSVKQVRKEYLKKQRNINAETLELHRYVILLTSLPEEITAMQVLELYRFRWQVEIAFKRLKSIIGLGHLPKIDDESCKAWLHGKMFIALLAQAIVNEGRRFFPWGYPIG
jgi:hypothetical protein